MSLLNRKDIRTTIAVSLRAQLATVYSSITIHAEPPVDFGGKSPLLVITSAGTDRTQRGRSTFGGQIAPPVRINLVTMALATGTADTVLDNLEAAIAEWIDANKEGEYWKSILYAGPSETTDVTTIKDGKQYRIETISLIFTGST